MLQMRLVLVALVLAPALVLPLGLPSINDMKKLWDSLLHKQDVSEGDASSRTKRASGGDQSPYPYEVKTQT